MDSYVFYNTIGVRNVHQNYLWHSSAPFLVPMHYLPNNFFPCVRGEVLHDTLELMQLQCLVNISIFVQIVPLLGTKIGNQEKSPENMGGSGE